MAAIALPLMLTTLSTNLMMFVDRLVLARYGLEGMNAATVAFIVCSIFIYPLAGVASSADVLVGRLNGAREFSLIGRPVWQIFWLCLAIWPIFILLGIFGGDIFLPNNFENLGGLYYRPIMCFGPLTALNAAASAFFLGRGKTGLVVAANLIGNVVNGIFDVLLVFGVVGFPEMGIEGAAVATVIGQSLQLAILLFIFWAPKNRRLFNTWNWRFCRGIFKECLRLGLPGAVGYMLELAAWSYTSSLLARAGDLHLTLLLLGQNVFLLMAFATDALNKASAAVASNYVGARDWTYFRKAIGGAVSVFFLIVGSLALVLYFFQAEMLNLFVADQDLGPSLHDLKQHTGVVFLWITLSVWADGIAWIFAANLLALGDSKFLLFANGTAAWCACVVPMYLIIVLGGAGPEATWPIVLAYLVIMAFAFGLRLKIRYRAHETLRFDVVR